MKPISPSTWVLLEAASKEWASVSNWGTVDLEEFRPLPDALVLAVKNNFSSFRRTYIRYIDLSDHEDDRYWFAVGKESGAKHLLIYPEQLSQEAEVWIIQTARMLANSPIFELAQNESWWTFVGTPLIGFLLLWWGWGMFDGSWFGITCGIVFCVFGLSAIVGVPLNKLGMRSEIREALAETNDSALRLTPYAN